MAMKSAFTAEEIRQLGDLTPEEQLALAGIQAQKEAVAAVNAPAKQELQFDRADADDAFRSQDQAMKNYFKNAKRRQFQNMTGEPLRVEINGYVVRVAPFESKAIPEEFIQVIEEKARVERKHALLASVYMARSGRVTTTLPGIG